MTATDTAAETKVYLCPLCPWSLTPPEPAPAGAANGIAAALGLSGLEVAASWEHRRLTDVERQLRTHLETHPVDEWATEVRRLRDLLAST